MTERFWAAFRPPTGRWSAYSVRCIAVMHEAIHNRTTGEMLTRAMYELHHFDAGSAAIVIDGGSLALFGVRLAEIGGRDGLTQAQALAIGSAEYATARALLRTPRPVGLASVFGIHVDAARQIHDLAESQGTPLRIGLAQ